MAPLSKTADAPAPSSLPSAAPELGSFGDCERPEAATAIDHDGAMIESIAADMSGRWQKGERPIAEEYLNRYPSFWHQPEAAVEIVYEEVCLRYQFGEAFDAERLWQRFPQWRRQLEVMLECHRLLELEVPRFPSVGEVVADFRLVAELGRGAQGRAYLATELTLAERPVVLKCVSVDSGEHLSLARLQHTHIVPLYAVYEDPARRLRILCMPYFGGVTLDRLLEAVRRDPAAHQTGRQLLAAIRRWKPEALASPIGESLAYAAAFPSGEIAAEGALAGASYTRAICWMGACLADALQYAQDRTVVHLDLKPSNILWTADGQPMLLDFHLARAPIAAGAQPPAWLGGTPAYMAPEQQLALAAVRHGTPIPEDLDGRTDIYGLGAVLYEALGGPLPMPEQAPGRDLRRANAAVSLGLADIIAKCLAREPRRRYPTAAAVAADLRRHLADQPLQGVGNRSLPERWRKWRRRRPNTLPVVGLAVIALAMGAAGAVRFNQQRQDALAALSEGQAHLRNQRFGAAILVLKGGLALVDGLPWHDELIRDFRNHLELAQRAQEVRDFHSFVEDLRILVAEGTATHLASRTELALCRRFWVQRVNKFQQLQSVAPVNLPEGNGSREKGEGSLNALRNDFEDLAISWVNLEVLLASPEEKTPARLRALAILAEAEALLGSDGILARERQTHAAILGRADIAGEATRQVSAFVPRTAWQHFAFGRAHLQAGDTAAAAPYLQAAVEMNSRVLWPNFYLGKCALQRGELDTALQAFNACVVLAPESASCHYHRGRVYAARGQHDRALRDLDRALAIDPYSAEAALERGMLYLHMKRHAEAEADLQSALQGGADKIAILYQLALVQIAQAHPSAARTSLETILQLDPHHQAASTLLNQLKAGDPPSAK